MKTILVPIDFSSVSRPVMAAAVVLARAFKGRVVLLHVVQQPVVINEYDLMVTDVARMAAGVERAAARHLAALKKSLERRLPEVTTVCRSGPPVLEILDQARKCAADYIVIGSHGHSAFYDLLAGSTASGVLKRSRCPVLVVPPPKIKSAKSGK
jgi:nucleotide-binding universal stress UspA family protein